MSLLFESVASHLNLRRGEHLSSLGDAKSDEGKCFMFAKPAVAVLKRPANMLRKIKGDWMLALESSLAIGVKAWEHFLKEVLLICWTFGVSGVSGREIRKRLVHMAHSIPTFTTILLQVRKAPSHQFISCNIGKITVDGSRYL